MVANQYARSRLDLPLLSTCDAELSRLELDFGSCRAKGAVWAASRGIIEGILESQW